MNSSNRFDRITHKKRKMERLPAVLRGGGLVATLAMSAARRVARKPDTMGQDYLLASPLTLGVTKLVVRATTKKRGKQRDILCDAPVALPACRCVCDAKVF
jgi:hypothetical protein